MPHKYALIIAGAEEIVKSFFVFLSGWAEKTAAHTKTPLPRKAAGGVGLPEFFVRGAYRKLEMP